MIRKLAGYAFGFLVVATGLGFVLKNSPDAREVAGEAVWNLFRFFTTPFILETTVAIFGLLVVTTYNQWRRSKDGPEWVEMEVPDKPKDDDSSGP